MSEENEQAQEVVEEQEETTQEEEVETTDTDTDADDESADVEEEEEETVTLKKSDFSKLNRKAKAYDANKKPEKKTDITTKSSNAPSEELQRINLRLDGYSREEVDEIMDLGGVKVLKSQIVQNAIKAMRAEKKSKDANQNFPAKSPVYKKYTQEDLKGMSSAELEKILPHV